MVELGWMSAQKVYGIGRYIQKFEDLGEFPSMKKAVDQIGLWQA